MHYTAMLAYRGIGDTASAEREQKLFQRFKTEESAQAITAKRRLVSPEDNNERQAIHDHESIDLKAVKASDSGPTAKKVVPVRRVSKPVSSNRRMEARVRPGEEIK